MSYIYGNMTKSDLTEIIRKIVAEEVRNQFPSLLAEVLNAKKPVIRQESVQKKPVIQAPVAPQRPRVEVSTGNPKLDAILRETTAGFAGSTYAGPNVDVDGGFGFIGEGIDVPGTTEHIDEIPSVVPLSADFMKRDYSALLKKADKAANSMRGQASPL